jgi:hypothetical protein
MDINGRRIMWYSPAHLENSPRHLGVQAYAHELGLVYLTPPNKYALNDSRYKNND